SGCYRGMEMGHPGVVARWADHDGRDLQGGGEADLRQGCVAARSVAPVQLKPGRRHAPRHRFPRGRQDQREGAEGADPGGGGAQPVEAGEGEAQGSGEEKVVCRATASMSDDLYRHFDPAPNGAQIKNLIALARYLVTNSAAIDARQGLLFGMTTMRRFRPLPA